jgi:drug/metabolite transporter (DMT)-like permease
MIFLVVVSVVWAFSFPLIKLHLTDLDANFVALARMVLALLVLLPFLRLRKVETRLGVQLAAIGALQMGVMYVAYIRSFQYLQSYEVALLTIMTPLWITLFSSVLSRRLEPRFHLAALLAIVGAAIIVVRRDALGPAIIGVALVQVSNIAFGVGQILYKRTMVAHPELRSRDVFALLYAGAVLVTLAATAVTFDPSQFEMTRTQLVVLVYLGVVAAGIGFVLWNHGATKVSDGTLAVMNNGYMPLAVLAGLVWLGEEADPVRLLVGTACLVAALWLAQRIGPQRN